MHFLVASGWRKEAHWRRYRNKPSSGSGKNAFMQNAYRADARRHDVFVHYFLRPDHRDIGDLWIAGARRLPQAGSIAHNRDWIYRRLESLHAGGAMTFCGLHRPTGSLAGFVTVDPAACRLEQIVVARSARGSGVAASLLDAAKQASPQRIDVEIEEDNPRAIRFCEREGFRKAGLGASDPGGGRVWRLRWRGDGS